ncbi:unnamed protein product [Pleuronectes platessa]|uniref:Uncharacterized protein n=1 Tax=Pleuronectes platessa TaxID=8262 RepID=A0A9N7VCW8_PLEPL|nr:unnamed protein product [Pleuronectes platessa]
MSSILEPNRVIISTNLPSGALWLTLPKRHPEGDNKFLAAGHWGEGASVSCSHESYLQLLVKLPSGMTLQRDTAIPALEPGTCPESQHENCLDAECTLFRAAHNGLRGNTMRHLAELGGESGDRGPPVVM